MIRANAGGKIDIGNRFLTKGLPAVLRVPFAFKYLKRAMPLLFKKVLASGGSVDLNLLTCFRPMPLLLALMILLQRSSQELPSQSTGLEWMPIASVVVPAILLVVLVWLGQRRRV